MSITVVYGLCFGLAYLGLSEFWRALEYYCFYMSLANSVIPLAVNPPTVAAGAVYSPVLVGVLGAIATGYANLSEFLLLGPVLAHRKLEPLRKTRLFQKVLSLLDRWPQRSIYCASLLPIPVDVIRFAAIASGFPARRYLMFDWLGRFTRYSLLAWMGNVFQGSFWTLALIMAFFLLVPLLASRAFKSLG